MTTSISFSLRQTQNPSPCQYLMDSIPNYDPGLLIPGRQADFTVPGTPGAPETEDIVGTDRHRSAIAGTAQGDQQPVPPAGIEPPSPDP